MFEWLRAGLFTHEWNWLQLSGLGAYAAFVLPRKVKPFEESLQNAATFVFFLPAPLFNAGLALRLWIVPIWHSNGAAYHEPRHYANIHERGRLMINNADVGAERRVQ